ncbi:MAG TPA: SHOCT domain-containing protein [Motilibacteraceae bacterium]|nr:SHOCT domain-containing protein [Motilibacteraceae bacterium]
MVEARADIAEAFGRVKNSFGMRREIKNLPEHLEPGERVLEVAGGRFARGSGLLALTDRRVVFLFHGLVHTNLEEFRLARIDSVAVSSGVLWSSVTLTVAGNRAVIEQLDKTDGKRMVDAIRLAVAAAHARTATGGAPAEPDVVSQLERLGELRDRGVLTDAEFAAKKAELLARL